MPLTSADRPLLLVPSLEAADDIFVLLCLPHPAVSEEFLFPIRNRTSNILSNKYQIQFKMANTFPLHAVQVLGYRVETAQFLLGQTCMNAVCGAPGRTSVQQSSCARFPSGLPIIPRKD